MPKVTYTGRQAVHTYADTCLAHEPNSNCLNWLTKRPLHCGLNNVQGLPKKRMPAFLAAASLLIFCSTLIHTSNVFTLTCKSENITHLSTLSQRFPLSLQSPVASSLTGVRPAAAISAAFLRTVANVVNSDLQRNSLRPCCRPTVFNICMLLGLRKTPRVAVRGRQDLTCMSILSAAAVVRGCAK